MRPCDSPYRLLVVIEIPVERFVLSPPVPTSACVAGRSERSFQHYIFFPSPKLSPHSASSIIVGTALSTAPPFSTGGCQQTALSRAVGICSSPSPGFNRVEGSFISGSARRSTHGRSLWITLLDSFQLARVTRDTQSNTDGSS